MSLLLLNEDYFHQHQGYGSAEKIRELSQLVCKEKLDILAIQDTFMEQEVDASIQRIWNHIDMGFAQQLSVGRSYGWQRVG